jgi:cell wall assembly regulator SMI1
MTDVTLETVKFKLNGPLAKLSAIQAAEKHFGFSFPDDYREFLVTINGGRLVENYIVRVEDIDDDVMIGALYSIGGKCDIVMLMTTTMATIPQGFVVFAVDPGGNQFLMDLNDENSYPIYYWEGHNYFRPPEKRKKRNNTFHVADSFTEFLRMFRLLVDEDRRDETDGNDSPIVDEPPAPEVKLAKLKSAEPMAEKPAKAKKPPKKST